MSTAEQHELDEQEQSPEGVVPLPPLHERLRGWVAAAAAAAPRPWSQRQPCLAELVTYSRTGEYSRERAGVRRAGHTVFTLAILLPVSAAADGLKWIVVRPGRFCLAVALVAVFALAVAG